MMHTPVIKVEAVPKTPSLDSIICEVVQAYTREHKQPLSQDEILSKVKAIREVDIRILLMRLAYTEHTSHRLVSFTLEGVRYYWPAADDGRHLIIRYGAPNPLKPKTTKIKIVTKPKPKVVVRQQPFELSDEHEPIWSVNSRGQLECVQDGKVTLRLSPAHAIHMQLFLRGVNGLYKVLR